MLLNKKLIFFYILVKITKIGKSIVDNKTASYCPENIEEEETSQYTTCLISTSNIQIITIRM